MLAGFDTRQHDINSSWQCEYRTVVTIIYVFHAGAQKSSSAVAVLTQMQSIAVTFGHNLARALDAAPQEDIVKVVRAVYAPHEGQITR